MSDTSAAKAPDARAGKGGGNITPPPPDKPKDWKTLPVTFQYKDSGGIFEFRVLSAAPLPEKLREVLHEQHGIAAAEWEAK